MRFFIFIVIVVTGLISCNGQSGGQVIVNTVRSPECDKVVLFYSYLFSDSIISETQFFSVFGTEKWAEAEEYLKRQNDIECFIAEEHCPSYIFPRIKTIFLEKHFRPIISCQEICSVLYPSIDDSEVYELTSKDGISRILFVFRNEKEYIYIEDIIMADGTFIFEEFEE